MLNELATSTETMNRCGVPPRPGPAGRRPACHPAHPQGPATLNGTLDPGAATKQAQADLEQIAQSIT